MIEYKYNHEKTLLDEYASHLGDTDVQAILAAGRVDSPAQARTLARFYWRMVDASIGDDIEPWLERIHTTLFIALGNAGYSQVWDDEIPP